MCGVVQSGDLTQANKDPHQDQQGYENSSAVSHEPCLHLVGTMARDFGFMR